MIKSFIATAAIAVFGFASAASAHHVSHQPFVQSESEQLLTVVEETGHRILVDPQPFCSKDGLMGAASSAKDLIICETNHQGDLDELSDTIRHEVLHLAQFCKARAHGSTHALLLPDSTDDVQEYAVNELHFVGLGYEESSMLGENEARVLAHALDEWQVAEILVQECGEE